MADYTGTNANIQWVHAGGTAVLSTDYRSVSVNPSIGLADTTAGADTDKTYIATIKDTTIEYAGLMQAGGTVIKAALAAGVGGTLILSSEGTASGKPKESYPAIAMGAKMLYPYDNVVEITCSFQKNGAVAETSW